LTLAPVFKPVLDFSLLLQLFPAPRKQPAILPISKRGKCSF